MNNEPILCYISEGGMAYFTTNGLDQEWGDDWDDAPYEHNAGTPYGRGGSIVTLCYLSDMETPATRYAINSPYSVRDINQRKAAWLAYPHYSRPKGATHEIYAGTPISQFIKIVESGGGEILFSREAISGGYHE